MITKKYQKTIICISLAAIILSSAVFLFIPQHKAQAIVPTYDAAAVAELATIVASNAVIAESAVSLEVKEYLLDTALWAFVKPLIMALVNDVVNNVISGNEGGEPFFIRDIKLFIRNSLAQASGYFLENMISNEMRQWICEPWKAFEGAMDPLYLVLRKIRRGHLSPLAFPRCTLIEDLINGKDPMRHFLTDFRSGGWDAWINMVENPMNNPLGQIAVMGVKMEEEMAKADERAKTEAQMNSGFVANKLCSNPSDENVFGESFCDLWDTLSPGKWIQEQLSQHTGTEIRTLEIADELSEVIGVLAGMAMNWMVNGLTSGTQGGADWGQENPNQDQLDDINNQTQAGLEGRIQESIQEETQYRSDMGTAQSNYNSAASIYDSALQCFTSVNNDSSCSINGGSVTITMCSLYINDLNSQTNISMIIDCINTLTGSPKNLQSDINNATNNITQLESLLTQLADPEVDLIQIRTDYASIAVVLHNTTSSSMELSNSQTALSEAQSILSICQNVQSNCGGGDGTLPPPPPPPPPPIGGNGDITPPTEEPSIPPAL